MRKYCRLALGDVFLAVATADADAVDNVALLGLVAETTSLVGARGTRSTVDNVQLTVFPATNAEQETEDIRLLLLVKFPNVFVGTHPVVDRKEKSLLSSDSIQVDSQE